MALLGALTPLVQWRNGYGQWLAAVATYSAAGLISSGVTGFLIGESGSWLMNPMLARLLLALILPMAAIISAAREIGLIRFPVPERKVQTESLWMNRFGPLQAAAMWGFHLGFGFTTRVTYMGYWLLVLSIFALHDAKVGAALLGIYWLGRALPIWLAPLLVSRDDTSLGTTIMGHALSSRPVFQALQFMGDITLAAVMLGVYTAR
jgi:hypothetical protein